METDIEWRDVPSVPGYQASSIGSIRRIAKKMNGHRTALERRGALFNNGYRYVQTTVVGGTQKPLGVHRMVCEAFHGAPAHNKSVVRHLDGNRENNKPENLAWGSQRENCRDQRLHGTLLIGSKNGFAKIDEHDVIAMFCLRRRGFTGDEIGCFFGLHGDHVNKVIRRELWAHVNIPIDLLTETQTVQARYRGSQNGISVTKAQRRQILERDGLICSYCSSTEGPFHIDHVRPISQGGKSFHDNLAVACSRCNLSKGKLTPEQWMVA